MRKVKQQVIMNSEGKPITLTNEEAHHAKWIERQINERFSNELGFEIPITTMTMVQKKVAEQKFFEVTPSDYLPVKVGNGAWSRSLTQFRSFDLADDFETGIINTGRDSSRLASADAGLDALNIKIFPWAKQIEWNLFELQEAAQTGVWDAVASKEKARKKNYDLGIQRIAFLGAKGLNSATGACLGLLNQPSVTVNTTVITKPIKSMTGTELKTFCGTVYEAFRSNCNRTAVPDRFILPESDFNGLASTSSADFPIKSVLQILTETFQTITQNPGFKILPLSYCDAAYSGLGVQKYVLTKYDEESICMNIPLAYTATLANSLNGFSFQNAAYSQFTGVLAVRPLETLYFEYTP